MNDAIHVFKRLPVPGVLAQSAGGGEPREPRERPLVGVVRNPRSHRNMGHDPEQVSSADVIIETPRTHDDLVDALARFARQQVDYIVVDGGDGTVRDVLTCGAGFFGENWPALVVLPKGKTNALAVDLGLPRDWSLGRALDAAENGRRLRRRALIVAEADNPQARAQGFIVGAGVFTAATSLGQDAHRWGAFNSLAVGVTALWTIGQAILGRTGRGMRKTTTMRLAMADGSAFPHSDLGPRDQRFFLLASTLERFPLGARPFGALTAGLKIAVLDTPRRLAMVLVPALLTGLNVHLDRIRGTHQATIEDGFDLEIEGCIVLDGEAFPPGHYRVSQGPSLDFIVP